MNGQNIYLSGIEVLIESDWNLKECENIFTEFGTDGINRIRLEFKAKTVQTLEADITAGINRIRLEFKVYNSTNRHF